MTMKNIFAIGDCCDADNKMAFAAGVQGFVLFIYLFSPLSSASPSLLIILLFLTSMRFTGNMLHKISFDYQKDLQ